MIWKLLLVGILITVILDISCLIKPKPTFKSALKRICNNHINILVAFMPMNIGVILLSAYVCFIYLGKQSTDLNVIVVASGMQWGMFCMIVFVTMAMFWKVVTPMIKSKPDEFSQWIKHFDIDGIWRYTESEKEYNKAQDIKSKEQIRRWFPFIKKLDKKKVV